MLSIELTQGYKAVVDEDDYEFLNQFKWHALIQGENIYACRYQTRNKKQRYVRMHRAILGVYNSSIDVDHINRNTLDNRKSNIRMALHYENLRNRSKQKNNTSGYKGVSWHKQLRRWSVRIKHNGKYHSIGTYYDKRDAALAYNVAAHIFHNKFANKNILERRENVFNK